MQYGIQRKPNIMRQYRLWKPNSYGQYTDRSPAATAEDGDRLSTKVRQLVSSVVAVTNTFNNGRSLQTHHHQSHFKQPLSRPRDLQTDPSQTLAFRFT
jgi:hypothetical protein